MNEVKDDPYESHFGVEPQTSNHKSDMADDQVAENFPEVILGDCAQCARNDGQDRDPADQLLHKVIRNKNKCKYPQNGVDTYFGQQAGKDGRDCWWRSMIRSRQPEIQRENCGFYSEAYKEQSCSHIHQRLVL